MKFCVVIGTHPDDTPGGAELQSQLLSAELASRSHECHYFAYASTQALPETVEGVHVHTRHNPTRRAILREIDDLDCDVYYFRNMADIPLAVYTDRLLSGSVIYNVSHDRQCRPLVALDHTVDTTLFEKVYANLREMFYRSLVPSLRNIVVQTRSQQRLLEQNRGIQAPIIGNGQRAPSRDFKKESPPVVLWLASIKDWKRPELFARLAERCNDLNATFRIVGRPSDQELAAEVRKKARQLDNLEYLGGCTISESDEYIGRASIFVNTSIEEGFPNTFIQSWFRQTPVVSLSVDPDSVLTDNDIGYVTGDFESMVERIRTLIQAPEKRQDIGAKAYDYAKQRHDIEVVVDRLESYIERELPVDT